MVGCSTLKQLVGPPQKIGTTNCSSVPFKKIWNDKSFNSFKNGWEGLWGGWVNEDNEIHFHSWGYLIMKIMRFIFTFEDIWRERLTVGKFQYYFLKRKFTKKFHFISVYFSVSSQQIIIGSKWSIKISDITGMPPQIWI